MNVLLYLLNDARKATVTGIVVAVVEPSYRLLASGQELTIRGAATSVLAGCIAGLTTWGVSNRSTAGYRDEGAH